MLDMDGRDVVLLVIAGYLAITALARVMSAYRRRLLAQVRDEAEAEVQRRQQASEGERAKAA
ncbi:MAG: hypothetical protein U0836_10280 [Pirellulales bacterium]